MRGCIRAGWMSGPHTSRRYGVIARLLRGLRGQTTGLAENRPTRCLESGTEGRTRTDKLLPAGDFESPVSTNSTTPA